MERSRRGSFQTGPASDWRPPLLRFRFVSTFLSPCDAKQAFCGDAAVRARALHLVDAGKSSLARCADSHSICSDLSARERVDYWGTEISYTHDRSGLGL